MRTMPRLNAIMDFFYIHEIGFLGNRRMELAKDSRQFVEEAFSPLQDDFYSFSPESLVER